MKKEKKIIAIKKLIKFVKSKEFGGGKRPDGICLTLGSLDTSFEQDVYIRSILPEKRYTQSSGYVWEPGLKKPRIEFLQGKLKKLNNNKKRRSE